MPDPPDTTALTVTWDHVLKPGAPVAAPAGDLFQSAAPLVAAGEFSIETACHMAAQSLLIYREHADREDALARIGMRETFAGEAAGTLCSIVEPADTRAEKSPVTVVFRGTSHLKNWLTNLQSLPTGWPGGGHVHGGFYAAHQELYSRLAPRLEEAARSGRPVHVTGHSLGGALATLTLAQFFKEHPGALAAGYTFGSPRVGNGDFAASLENASLFRIVNGQDLVTRLPLAFSLSRRLSFLHAGDAHYIDLESRVHRRGRGDIDEEQASLTQIKIFILHSAEAFKQSRPPTFLADHAPARYLEKLRRSQKYRQAER